jgi:anaphase-promoting complex subunit 8
MDNIFNFCLQDVKKDIYRGIDECNKRGLCQSAKFLAELNHGLKAPQPVDFNSNKNTGISDEDYDDYQLAKSYFDNREYDRASYFTKTSTSPVPKFLHLYSNYMAKEKKRLDNMTENSTLNNNIHFKDLSDLLTILKNEHSQKQLDGFGLYLYGVVLKKLDLNQAAIPIFLESIYAEPTMWGSWLELSPLITNKEKLHNLEPIPNHWMKHFFVAFTYVELFLNDEGLKHYEELQMAGFDKSVYITSQMAIAYHNKRDVEKAIDIFKHLQIVDPYRLDNLDIYSNLLFVKEMKKEMAFLAHKAVEINKYRPETCCVVGKTDWWFVAKKG